MAVKSLGATDLHNEFLLTVLMLEVDGSCFDQVKVLVDFIETYSTAKPAWLTPIVIFFSM